MADAETQKRWLVYYHSAVPEIIMMANSQAEADRGVSDVAELERESGWTPTTVYVQEITLGFNYLRQGDQGPLVLPPGPRPTSRSARCSS